MPIPPVERRPARLVGDGLYLLYDLAGDELVELPDELYLRELFDLDDDDPEAVAAWSGAWGSLTLGGFAPSERLPDEDLGPEIDAMHYAQDLGLNPGLVVPVQAATAHVRTLRAMVRHWLAYTEHPRGKKGILAAWDGAMTDVEDAWRRFERSLNRALRPFQVRVLVGTDDEALQVGVERPDSYSAMALQLVNHIAETATYRRCANETCGRLFVRQRGGAVYVDQRHSTGVMYCTPHCARAQAQREYRRRKRQEASR